MIRPEEVAHRNYMLWEQSIDAYLRAHDWTEDDTCEVPLNVEYASIQPILQKYEDVGWKIAVNVRGEDDRSYSFTLDGFVLDAPS